jgi:uncharacterized membrane protein YgdD (TMEM256/DUF423 family)
MKGVFLTLGALSAATAVFVGGARGHYLGNRLPSSRLPMLEVGMRYQMAHAVGLMLTSVAVEGFGGPMPHVAGWGLVVGTIVFCGAMYSYALSGQARLLKLAPIGGLIFMLSWLALAISPWW